MPNYFLIVLLFFTSLLFSQDFKPSIDNIAPLKQELIDLSISDENLFQLASLYLANQIYPSAIEMYNLYIARIQDKKNHETQLSLAYYNKGTALFSQAKYNSALDSFESAYAYNDTLIEALRLIGTIYFIQKNKDQALYFWKEYLSKNTEDSPERQAIASAVEQLSQDDFTFEEEEAKPTEEPNKSWPFLDPESIPNPRSRYEKKRII